MDLDATINSHPIIQTVEHPDQITEIFIYQFGANTAWWRYLSRIKS
jgi:hypothetical protein